ncbi:ankyrin repeat-containing protein ITN1-like protein [Cinnamomum micranthum f. kanehirae]|uniref:Ankyrin repeat-containing protein ITN1-like protein n=1 Tax=Cinnamomum micranthum f. kanehirae TaxID=337451 RepID=A0A3S3MZ58_9MAGN|nr:ankyrin repeat-containing protein ITN1-like protein [Cinnamomum micranthum f. kanehirae]
MENMEQRVYDACATGNEAKFRSYVEENQSVLEQMTASCEIPLHLASKFKCKELAFQILGRDSSLVTKKDCEGETPLHKACRVGELEIVKQMLVCNPSVSSMLNNANKSALFIACEHKHFKVASEICNAMPSLSWDEKGALACLHLAATEGDPGIVRKILEENISLASRKDDDGFSSMHLASREGKDEVIKTLIEKDSNLSFLKDNDERTPLHTAVNTNQLSVVEAFLSSTSLTNAQVTQLINGADKDGNTVLHLAATNDNFPVIELLLTRRPIKLNDANNEGLTALDILEKDQKSEAGEDASSGQRARIINQLKAGKRPDPVSQTTMQETSLNNMRQALIVVAGLIVTLTFQAGLNPPGGLWQDSKQGNETNHKPGKAIQSETNLWLFSVFLASNALGFILSLALIPLIMTLQTNTLRYVNSLVVMALVSVEVAFIFGLIMISDRKPLYHVEIFVLIFVTLAGIIGWAKWKLIRS